MAQQKLGLVALTSLVAGNMIGSGVFILPANLARIGSISLLSWLFTACGAFLLAIMFSKMSSMVRKTGGPYVFVEDGFGKFMGFQTAYTYWLYAVIGNVAITIALVGYLQVFLPQLANPTLSIIAAVIIIGGLTWINISGMKRVGEMQTVMTVLKLIPLVVVALLGWRYFHLDYIINNFNVTGHSDFSAFSQAATLTLWAFMGMESASVPSESVDNPSRNIPLATLLGTLIAAVLYTICSAVIMGMIPMNELAHSTSPFAAAAKMIFGQWGEWIIAGGAVASCAGALNGWILVQSQVAMAAADNGLFPSIFAKRNRSHVPGWGLVITFGLMCLALLLVQGRHLVDQFELTISVAVTSALLCYIYTAMSELLHLSRNEEMASNAGKAHSLVALLATAYCIWALFGAGRDIIFYVMLLVLSASFFYVVTMVLKQSK